VGSSHIDAYRRLCDEHGGASSRLGRGTRTNAASQWIQLDAWSAQDPKAEGRGGLTIVVQTPSARALLRRIVSMMGSNNKDKAVSYFLVRCFGSISVLNI
jgi:hypothetical protein